jgi:hypothetical protein
VTVMEWARRGFMVLPVAPGADTSPLAWPPGDVGGPIEAGLVLCNVMGGQGSVGRGTIAGRRRGVVA